jgi:hypothetical protein
MNDERGGRRGGTFGGNTLGSLWVFALVALVLIYQAVDSQRFRTLIVSGIAVLILLGATALGAWALRLQTVPRAVAMIFLVGVVLISSLLPVFFLGTTDRILLLKLGAIGFLSLFPGLLYSQFIAVRAKTLWTEYVLNLHRLKADRYENLPQPPPSSLYRRAGEEARREDANNLYVQKFLAAYGTARIPGDKDQWTDHRKKGSLLPVGLCTILLAVGWALVVQPEPISTDQILRSVTLSGQPILPVEALRFAFLGSYVFVIEILIRRYFQDDLKASAYLTCTERILTAVLFVTAIHQVWRWDAGQEAAFAFAVGVFPMVGVRALQSLLSMPLRPLLKNLDKEYPLSEIDGLNIWYESRLLELGIEDMQNLATANIVDVMLRTRVPVGRLVDWIDQAILDLRVRDGGDNSDRADLRRLGIRTATDLEDALRPSAASPWVHNYGQMEPEGFVQGMQDALNDRAQPSVIFAIWKTLAREPNLYHVRRWKEYGRELHEAWSPSDEGRRRAARDAPILLGNPSEIS